MPLDTRSVIATGWICVNGADVKRCCNEFINMVDNRLSAITWRSTTVPNLIELSAQRLERR